mmetsp:Transcript_10887/g.30051  ORF Transcript_10887/g.30051 Transcript_10887/m.30051 type:complete len:93 (-) Transcript_10887:280-558(-)
MVRGHSETVEQHVPFTWEDVAEGRTFKVCFDVTNVVLHEIPGRSSHEYAIQQERLAIELQRSAPLPHRLESAMAFACVRVCGGFASPIWSMW